MITDFFDIDTSLCQVKKPLCLPVQRLPQSTLYHPDNLKEIYNQEINHRGPINSRKRIFNFDTLGDEDKTDLSQEKLTSNGNVIEVHGNEFSLFDDIKEQFDDPGRGYSPLVSHDLSLNVSEAALPENSSTRRQTLSQSSCGTDNEFYHLKADIKQRFLRKLPELAEYRDKGFNSPVIDQRAVTELQESLQTVPLQPLQPALVDLCYSAREFLTTLLQNASQLHNGDATDLANRLINHIADALKALNAASTTGSLSWSQEADRTLRELRRKMIAAAMSSPLPGADDNRRQDHPLSALSVTQTTQRLEGLLTSEANLLTAEHFKFNLLKHSLLAESRITRLKLAAYLQVKSASLVKMVREVREYLDQQLMRQVRGHGSDETALTMARAMLPVARQLEAVIILLHQEQQRLRPPAEAVQSATYWHEDVSEKCRQVMAAAAALTHSAKKYAGKTSKLTYRTKHTVAAANYAEEVKAAVRGSALLLLDEIQQAEQLIKQLPALTMDLEESVEQHSRLNRDSRYAQTHPTLNALLSEQLSKEAERWQLIGRRAAEKLRTFIAPLTRMAEDEGKPLLSQLSLEPVMSSLNARHRESIQRFDEELKAVVDELASFAEQLNGAVIRLAEHGHQGGKELWEKTTAWRRVMDGLKGRVKTAMMKVTGTSLNNFSRGGMLTRGISEWAEVLKQDYLQEKSPVERKAAGVLFDHVVISVFKENCGPFARKSDPGAELFLKRLALAQKHASAGTTHYPPTPEEILAGCRTLPDDLRHWAEKKVVSGAISALLRGGFKLAVSGISLPLRIAIRGARTTWRLSHGIHAINQGVRLGQQAPTLLKNDYLYQEISKAGLRLMLSLSPLAGYGAAASVTGWHQYNHYKKGGSNHKIVAQIMIYLSEDLFWRGIYFGIRAAEHAIIRAYYKKLINDVLQDLQKRADAAEENTLTKTKTHAILPDEQGEYTVLPRVIRGVSDDQQSVENVKFPLIHHNYDILQHPLSIINLSEYDREKKRYSGLRDRLQELQEHIEDVEGKIYFEQKILDGLNNNFDRAGTDDKYYNQIMTDEIGNQKIKIKNIESEKNELKNKISNFVKENGNESEYFKAIHSTEQQLLLHPEDSENLINKKIGIINKLMAGEEESVDPKDRNLLEQKIALYCLMQKENKKFKQTLLHSLVIPKKLSNDKINALTNDIKNKSATEQSSILNAREQDEERVKILKWYLDNKVKNDFLGKLTSNEGLLPLEGRIYSIEKDIKNDEVMGDNDGIADDLHKGVKEELVVLNGDYWPVEKDERGDYFIKSDQPVYIYREVDGNEFVMGANGYYKPWRWKINYSNEEIVEYYLERIINLDNYPKKIKHLINSEANRIIRQNNDFTFTQFTQALHSVLTVHAIENGTVNPNPFAFYMLIARSEIDRNRAAYTSEYVESDNDALLIDEIITEFNSDDLNKYLSLLTPGEVDYESYIEATLPMIDHESNSLKIEMNAVDELINFEKRSITARIPQEIKYWENLIINTQVLAGIDTTNANNKIINMTKKINYLKLEKINRGKKLDQLEKSRDGLLLRMHAADRNRDDYISAIRFVNERMAFYSMQNNDQEEVYAEILNEIAIIEMKIKYSDFEVELKSNELKKTGIAKYHLFNKKNVSYAHANFLFSEDKEKRVNIDKMVIESEGDIFSAEKMAKRQSYKLDKSEQNYLTALIFYAKNHPEKDVRTVDPEKIMAYMHSAVRKFLNETYFNNTKLPVNYIASDNFKPAYNFAERTEYTKQFSDYQKNGSSAYEAENIATVLINNKKFDPANLIKPPKNIFAFQTNIFTRRDGVVIDKKNIQGKVYVMVLDNNDYIFIYNNSGVIELDVSSYNSMKSLSNEAYQEFKNENISRLYKFPNQSDVTIHGIRKKIGTLPSYTAELASSNSDIKQLNLNQVHDELYDVKRYGNVKNAMKEVLKSYLNLRSTDYKFSQEEHSWIQSLAESIVPFYKEIYYSSTDELHQTDYNQLGWDIITVSTVLIGSGIKLAGIGKDAAKEVGKLIKAFRAEGYSGKALAGAVMKKLPGIGIKTSGMALKTVGAAGFDMIDPIALKKCSIKLIEDQKKSIIKFQEIASREKFPEQWGKTTFDRRFNNIKPDQGLYKIRPEAPQNIDDFEYYIVKNNINYRVIMDESNKTWRIVNPKNPNILGYAPPVEFNQAGEWAIHSRVGLRGGTTGYFKKLKWNNLFFKFIKDRDKRLQPVEINKKIHMIWIGRNKLSGKNINLSLQTAVKNKDYITSIVYDSNIAGYEDVKKLMLDKLKGSKIKFEDLRDKDYFAQMKLHPVFRYYEDTIAQGKYAQASDMLRYLLLKFEGGIYKDIDDIAVRSFGALAFPRGVGIMTEYAPEPGKASAFPNTPIAATKDNPVINTTLELVESNYQRGETNVLKLAGPDVFTEALHTEIPELRPKVLNSHVDQLSLAKQKSLSLPLKKPGKSFDNILTFDEIKMITNPYQSMRGLSGYVENGADHSWVIDKQTY